MRALPNFDVHKKAHSFFLSVNYTAKYNSNPDTVMIFEIIDVFPGVVIFHFPVGVIVELDRRDVQLNQTPEKTNRYPEKV